MSLNQLAVVRNRLNIPAESMRDEELQEELDRASRRVNAKVGKYLTYKVRVLDETLDDYQLPFDEIDSVHSVILDDDAVSSSYYTLAQDTGIVSFTSDVTFEVNDILEIRYVPTIFKDIELLMVEIDILNHRNIIAPSDERKAQIEELKGLLEDYLKTISKKGVAIGGMSNHPSSAYFDSDKYTYD